MIINTIIRRIKVSSELQTVVSIELLKEKRELNFPLVRVVQLSFINGIGNTPGCGIRITDQYGSKQGTTFPTGSDPLLPEIPTEAMKSPVR